MEREVRFHWHFMRPAWGRVVTYKPITEQDADSPSPNVEPTEGIERMDPVRQAVVMLPPQKTPPTQTSLGI